MNKPTIKELEGEYDKIPKTLNEKETPGLGLNQSEREPLAINEESMKNQKI